MGEVLGSDKQDACAPARPPGRWEKPDADAGRRRCQRAAVPGRAIVEMAAAQHEFFALHISLRDARTRRSSAHIGSILRGSRRKKS